MIPNNKIDTPPITGLGIVEIKAENFPIKLITKAKTAAPANTKTENILVIAKLYIFSICCTGGPPKGKQETSRCTIC